MTTNTETKRAPVAKIRVGAVTASIWDNTTDKGTRTSVSFQRSYKDSEGKWHNLDSFGIGELLELAKAADLAHTQLLAARSGAED
jgi:hypothetical protein